MFSKDNYDGKENYKRERESRLEQMEHLNRQAQDEFNDSFFNRSDNFSDYHKNSNNYIHEEEGFTYHDEKKGGGKGKKIILSIVAIGALSAFGYYLGFNHSNSVNKENLKACVEQNDKNDDKIKDSDKLAISQKLATSSENMQSLQQEAIPTRTPEPIVTPNAENRIVTTTIAKPSHTSTPTATPIKKEIKDIEVAQTHKEDTDIKKSDKIEAKENNIKATVNKMKKESRIVTNNRKNRKINKPQYIVVTVKKGDTLASLADKYYGNPMDFKRIVRANRDIRSSHSQLHLGQRVIIPIVTHSKNMRLVKVKKGDTLMSIAKRYYGSSKKYQKIIDANYKIKNIHTPLHVGEIIRVPR